MGADGYFKNGLNDAYIDELKVYSHLMNEEEIATDYNLNEDEVLHLTFNEENTNDISGKNNHANTINWCKIIYISTITSLSCKINS